ncbi:MAG: hypothetical protein KVP17_005225 [Porospora cf. gigantea B]|uniref:uncharacterized protein n=1 Tax=Porospora cf. gigantea B TaxID=2853592 RepID=UPI003571F402|nr:MAG: hypothetical protein KVP17_005225 [Porospora cf. gigantea B]
MAVFSTKAIEAVFLSIAGLAAISCLSRADYNLPLFLFIWWVFFHIPDDALTSPQYRQDQMLHEWQYNDVHHQRMQLVSKRFRQQRVLLGFIVISLAQDVFFLLYWRDNAWQSVEDFTHHFHSIVCLVALIELLLKVFVVLALLVPGSVMDCGSCCAKPDEYVAYEVQTYTQAPNAAKQFDYHVLPSDQYSSLHHKVAYQA